ncbi:hypothetical protein R3P38DRAFT_3342927 [Favolaschia claudopus]|uniref:Vacuolar protein sorting-associated protein 13 second N-terminal domain-containing protein n=1 Tax=Favolaschia claudopus TaxID=2862362 RepID=A0AAW0DWG8_9AGAR
MIDAPPVDRLEVSISNGGGHDSKLLLPTVSFPEASPARSDPGDNTLGEIWHDLEGRSVHPSKTEKAVDKIGDAAGTATRIASSEAVDDPLKRVMANDEVKAMGNAILEGVPAIMSALEVLTKAHPFLEAAYFPFKLIYQQETKRKDNDKKRNKLFEKIKDFMMTLSEHVSHISWVQVYSQMLRLKNLPQDKRRTTPNGESVPDRLKTICTAMKEDIEGCYNVLAVQERHSPVIKFLKASAWNEELSAYVVTFTNRREDLILALDLRSVVTIEEISKDVKKVMQLFSKMLTPQERDMERWIQQNGGEQAVMKDDKKCAAFIIEFQDSLGTTTAPVTISRERGGRLPSTDDDDKQTDKLVAELRKEYREDVRAVIRENMESYSKRFKMGLDDLGKDLGNKIQHQGDRLIKYLEGGPHKRIKNKIVYRVWKDQGWRGSVGTHELVLTLRDYLVERVERSNLPSLPTEIVPMKRPVSNVLTVRTDEEEGEDEDDRETDISVPLPDSWMTSYLQMKRLRYLEHPDSSGFTTISEINNFSQARPVEWSFPHWVSYWVIGWQIYATKYCVEIEELFWKMTMLKKQITMKMPGNTRYVNDYIEGCWQHVTALTSSIERYDGPDMWLEGKFALYVQRQESMLKERLEKFQYDIDALDTVALILHGDRIEGSIFILLAILLRRHVAKMGIAHEQDLHYKELRNYMKTVQCVVNAAWMRFLDLKEKFQHRQGSDLKLSFRWLSCGLFKNYYEWDYRLNPQYFAKNPMTARSFDWTLRSSAPTEDAPTTDNVAVPKSNPTLSKPSEAEMSITGKWYGFHSDWTKTRNRFMDQAMTCINFKCGNPVPESETETEISGDGAGFDFTVLGTLSSADSDQPANTFAVSFERTDDDGTSIDYTGTFFPGREIMTGTFTRRFARGRFLLKKVPKSAIMCARPLLQELNPKELWAFAIKAVVDDIKRRKPQLTYMCSRVTDLRRVLQFIYKDNRHLLETEEQLQYSAILRTFSFEQVVEVYKLSNWYNRASDLQPAAIQRSRIVCLECVSPDGYERSIDACSKPECIAAEVPHRTDVSHNPKTHLMVRFRDLLLLNEFSSVKQKAEASAFDDGLASVAEEDEAVAGDEVKEKVQEDVLTENAAGLVTAIVGESIAPPAAGAEAAKRASSADLPPLSTHGTPPEQSQSQSPSSPAPSSASTHLLSVAVTPVEEMVYEYRPLNCTVCQHRVVAPCWYCVTCYGEWVCDACETAVNELLPWDYIRRYRTEAEFSHEHNIMHPLVRVTGFKSDGDADAKTQGETAKVKWEEVEKRLEELVTVQARFEAVNSNVDKRLDGVERRLGEVETKLETRLANIERLLSSLVGRVVEWES